MKLFAKYHSILDVTQTAGAWNFTSPPVVDGANSGWIQLAPTYYLSSTYFDLAGFSGEDESIFPQAITVQQGSYHFLVNGQAGDSMTIIDLMTSIPIADIETDPLVAQAILLRGVGFPEGKLTFETTIYGRNQRVALDLDTQGQFPLVTNEFQFGSMSPTASDRIYCYRLVIINESLGTSLDRVIVGNARYVIEATAQEEPAHSYIMRLARSYELQQSPDRDK